MKMSHKSKHVLSLDSSNSSKIKGQDSENSNTMVAPRVNSYRRSSWLVDVNEVHGFDTQLISLEKKWFSRGKVVISSSQLQSLGNGKRGVGKTTLCQVLFNSFPGFGFACPGSLLIRIWRPHDNNY